MMDGDAWFALGTAVAFLWFVFSAGRWFERARMRRERTKPRTATAEQIAFLEALHRALERDLPDLEAMSRQDASALIDELRDERRRRRRGGKDGTGTPA